MKNRNIINGLICIFIAAVLIFSRMGYMGDVNIVTVIISLILGGFAVHSLIRLNFAGVCFPIAFICIIYDEVLGITALTPWTVLIVALLFSIGLSLIFSNKKRKIDCKYYENHTKYYRNNMDIGEESSERIVCSANFTGSTRYITSNNFQHASLNCHFAGLEVYFDKAQIVNEKAVIDVDVSFGAIEMYIPKEWKVYNQAYASLGGIEEHGRCVATGSEEVVITGNVSFGALEIYYI